MRRVLIAWCLAATAAAQEAEMRALLPRLGAEDYRTREEAERRLEALVREGGQGAFDTLESKVLPEVRAGTDFEVRLRVERVVRKLGTVQLLWWTELGPSLTRRPQMAVGSGVVVRSGSCGRGQRTRCRASRSSSRIFTSGWHEGPRLVALDAEK